MPNENEIESAKEFVRTLAHTPLSQFENLIKLRDIAVARMCANIVKTSKIVGGDQYGTYTQVSPDANELADVIESIIAKWEKELE